MKSTENTTRNAKNVLVAIDFGSATIRAIAAEEQAENRLKILAEERTPARGYIRNGIVQTTELEFTITTLVRLLNNRVEKSEIKSVFVSIGGRSMQLVEMIAKRDLGSNRLVSDKVLKEMKQECIDKFQRQNKEMLVFEVFPQHFWLDGNEDKQLTNPLGMKAKTLQGFYYALVGFANIREKLKRCFERTTYVLEDEEGILKPDALYTALLTAEEQQKGAAIIDFGAETTSLMIYQNERLQRICVVPFGASHITRDIESLGISAANAEKLKQVKGQAMEECVTKPVAINIPALNPDEPKVRITTIFLAYIIEARLKEITAKIFAQLNKFDFEPNSRLYLTGGGAKLENIIEFVQKHTHLQVSVGSHAEWLTDDTDEKFIDPEYSQLVGTLVRGAQYRKDNANKELSDPKVTKKGISEWFGTKILELFTDEDITDEVNAVKQKTK